ncbi:DNA cytosine methyltransferase [Novispirillum sp. DQ9]|uniref:DNA cytosine methyltransferase n=1 Tax=Novispirillum sp. DQ9 TaxID=3398612 RepID=UPI003C7A5745
MKKVTVKNAPTKAKSNRPTFVDVFAGCGGLSLGLMSAGWNGLFAIERDLFAFDTLSSNLISGHSELNFSWPDWLPKEPLCASECVERYRPNFIGLRGQIDLLVGGPPCQGYSSAGRRDPHDPRNKLFESYLCLVELLQPTLILLENVKGITADFRDDTVPNGKINYASRLIEILEESYSVHSRMLDLSKFGVPQGRSRFFLIGVRKGFHLPQEIEDPFEVLEKNRNSFLKEKGIVAPMSAKAAISDFELLRNGIIDCPDSAGFKAISYTCPRTPYQKLMHGAMNGIPSDTRLANHRPNIAARFQEIIDICHATGRLNTSLSKETRDEYGLKKQALRVLDPGRPAPTITSMPDDLLHYAEPRTLTVRENARLQSFPDWFRFKGKYTTGGHLRRLQVPRFTQVANAVPPLAAEAIGATLLELIAVLDCRVAA